jgi:predicted nucleotidyltransferase
MIVSYFSPDTQDFIRLLAENDVRYLIVGGEAVIYYGFARLTGDVDFFYDRSEDNVKRLFDTLKSFWKGEIPGIRSYTEFMKKGAVIQFGRPPNRLDLINDISAVSFENAWTNRVIEETKIAGKKYSIYYIGLDDLIVNKRKANRYKDLEDLKYLVNLKEDK